MNNYNKYTKYLPYATARQKQILETLLNLKNLTVACDALNCSKSNIENSLYALKKRAHERGFNEDHGMTDEHIFATSTYVRGGEDDNFVARWIKAKTPTERNMDRVLNLIEGFEYKPAPVIKASPKPKNSNLATLYTLTDFHLGMYCWQHETGDDWSTDIGGRVLMNGIVDMVDRTPDSKLGVLNIQGDFLHFDGLDPVTVASGHILDADTRFDRLIELAMDLLGWAVEKMLEKHDDVLVIICEGNHDPGGSIWLRKHLKKIFAKNDRAEILDDASIPYYAILHGEIMLGFHHGHKKKNTSLPALFSSEPRFRSMWGQAKYTYIHTGHYHHTEQQMSEDGGAIIERHPTLAARDAYAARGGYVSMRGARAITYDKVLGEVERITVLPRESNA